MTRVGGKPCFGRNRCEMFNQRVLHWLVRYLAFLFSLQKRSQIVTKKKVGKGDKNLFAPIANELL